jgi:anti-sigma factor RsiW
MEQQKLESLLIDYIDGKLNSVDKHYVEQELLKNPKSFKLYEELKEVIHILSRRLPEEPSMKLKSSFSAMLEEEIKISGKQKIIRLSPWWYRAAAAVTLLIVGVSLGFWISAYNQRQQEIARAKIEKEKTLQLVSMINNTESAGQRILGVKAAVANSDVNDEILLALIHTLDNDPNTNVRMAALEGLRRFYSEAMVRSALISSLKKQIDPVIQIQLIQVLVELKEKAAVKPLQEILKGNELLPAVKDEAQMGILVLS